MTTIYTETYRGIPWHEAYGETVMIAGTFYEVTSVSEDEFGIAIFAEVDDRMAIFSPGPDGMVEVLQSVESAELEDSDEPEVSGGSLVDADGDGGFGLDLFVDSGNEGSWAETSDGAPDGVSGDLRGDPSSDGVWPPPETPWYMQGQPEI